MDLPVNTVDELDLLINHEIKELTRKIEEKINKDRQEMKACKMKNELNLKLAQEVKINSELTQQLTQLNQRGAELERVCSSFGSLTIADSDKNRLDNANDMYQVAKELTGVRLDFAAPPNIAKGYVKNESRRLLQPFELDAGDTEALWEIIKNTSTQDWPVLMEGENINPN